jgi:membrane-associated phospholipid phosphatase
MRPFEWISLTYFVALGVLSFVRPLPISRRLAIAATSACTSIAILLLARGEAGWVSRMLPLPLILIGYYVSGLFAVHPSVQFERWLLSWDQHLLTNPATRFAHWPRLVLAPLELVYMGCFLLVPAGALTLTLVSAAPGFVDRYWAMVVAAEFASFISLPFVYARPPWALEQRAALPDRAVHRAATRFVEVLTIGANTFPSGHAAGSVAVALGVIGVAPAIGSALLALASAICAAAVIGRYHYTVDVVAGVVLALVLFAIIR